MFSQISISSTKALVIIAPYFKEKNRLKIVTVFFVRKSLENSQNYHAPMLHEKVARRLGKTKISN